MFFTAFYEVHANLCHGDNDFTRDGDHCYVLVKWVWHSATWPPSRSSQWQFQDLTLRGRGLFVNGVGVENHSKS